MGLASTSYRFFQYTNRKNTITTDLSIMANQKTSLTREMQKVSEDYREALSTKVFKWSNNGGVSYMDLNYANLTSPGLMNQANPYLITDNTGKVVIASNYKKYAEMISPNGALGGDYQSNRNKILSDILGIDSNSLATSNIYQDKSDDIQSQIDALMQEKATQIDPLKNQFTRNRTADLLENLGSATGGGNFKNKKNWKDAYTGNDTIKFYTASNLDGIGNQIKNLYKYFPDIKQKDFETKVNSVIDSAKFSVENSIKNNQAIESEAAMVTGSSSKGFEIKVKELIDQVLSSVNAESTIDTYGNTNYIWYDTNSDNQAYSKWQTLNENWTSRYNALLGQQTNVSNANNILFTADQESKIEFYDALFTSIADNGWTHNESVTDDSYLNEMFQNGLYSLTTVEKSLYTDGVNSDGTAKFNYFYSSDIAVNNTHVYQVNDSNLNEIALTEYNSKKRTINEKESRLDARMENLKTELNAIQTMLQSLDQIAKDNIERTMNITG